MYERNNFKGLMPDNLEGGISPNFKETANFYVILLENIVNLQFIL